MTGARSRGEVLSDVSGAVPVYTTSVRMGRGKQIFFCGRTPSGPAVAAMRQCLESVAPAGSGGARSAPAKILIPGRLRKSKRGSKYLEQRRDCPERTSFAQTAGEN
jgi:hypothetical protein